MFRGPLLVLLVVGVAVAAPTVNAESTFDITWFTIDGGGGRSSGDAYSVVGTIGQPDAGTLHGGEFTLAGGFWRGGGPGGSTPIDDDEDPSLPPTATPVAFRAYSARPNPFNPSTTINYDLPRDAHVRIDVFASDGRRVRTLVDESRPAGRHFVAWNGRSDVGHALASGMYFVRTGAGPLTHMQKITLLK